MIDVLLHIAGALGMQIAIALGLYWIGLPVWVGAIVGGVLSAVFWTAREVWQASGRQTRDGKDPHDWPAVWDRTHHIEWQAPALANAILAVAVGFYTAGPAKAQPQQPQCGPTALVEESLRSQHKERIVARLNVGNGVPAVIFANLSTGSFTVVVYPPDHPGNACLGGSGDGFQLVPLPREGSI